MPYRNPEDKARWMRAYMPRYMQRYRRRHMYKRHLILSSPPIPVTSVTPTPARQQQAAPAAPPTTPGPHAGTSLSTVLNDITSRTAAGAGAGFASPPWPIPPAVRAIPTALRPADAPQHTPARSALCPTCPWARSIQDGASTYTGVTSCPDREQGRCSWR
jgi:hypothetical protein